MTITKTKLFLALLVAAVLAPTLAAATHVFSDVDHSRFYADAVEWARDNEITNGTSPTTFSPEREVTRGEAVTFLKRYDDNIVQPALDEIDVQFAQRGIVQTYSSASGDGVAGSGESVSVDGPATLESVELEATVGSLMIQNSLSFDGGHLISMWVTIDQPCAITMSDEPVGAVLGTFADDVGTSAGALAGGGLFGIVDGSLFTVRLCAYTAGATTVNASALNVLHVPDPGV